MENHKYNYSILYRQRLVALIVNYKQPIDPSFLLTSALFHNAPSKYTYVTSPYRRAYCIYKFNADLLMYSPEYTADTPKVIRRGTRRTSILLLYRAARTHYTRSGKEGNYNTHNSALSVYPGCSCALSWLNSVGRGSQ